MEKDGQPLRGYRYGSFGNRTGMEDCGKGIQRAYAYDALNRLVKEETWENRSLLPEATSSEHGPSMEAVTQKSYAYDRRGNLYGEYQGGELLHGYSFGALNRMEKAWDNTGREAEYFYNGLGQRTGRKTGKTQEDTGRLSARPHQAIP